MTKHISTLLLCLAGLVFTSCYPYVLPAEGPLQPEQPVVRQTPQNTAPAPEPAPVYNPNQTVSSQAQKEIRRYEDLKPTVQPTTPSISAPSLPVKKSYPIAVPIPGKSGWVYNPYNNNPVMIQGIASGKTVRDPKDPNTDHKFKVP